MKTIALMVLLLSVGSTLIFAEIPQKLVLNTSYYAPITSPDHTGVLDILYQELSKRMGIAIEIQYLPAERALKNANSGLDDGDVCRILQLNATGNYPDLIRVPEQIMQFQMMVFTLDQKMEVTKPEDLKPYDVGIVTGWKILERNTTQARSAIQVEEGAQLFTLLEKKRINLAIIERMIGLKLLKDSGLKDVVILKTPFLQGDWYLYLHKKHQALVPMIVEKVQEMKKDGTYQKIFSEVLQRYAI
ncbi:transporter substrate-binding domain-containing protein [Deltaproteobacteria bacterium TL4]